MYLYGMAIVLKIKETMMGSRRKKNNNKNLSILYSVMGYLRNVSQLDRHTGSMIKEFQRYGSCKGPRVLLTLYVSF